MSKTLEWAKGYTEWWSVNFDSPLITRADRELYYLAVAIVADDQPQEGVKE